MRSLLRALCSGLLTLLASSLAGADLPPPARQGVEVTFLANEGVLVAGGGRAVLLDGCVREPYSVYGAVPDAVWERLLAGEPPFERLDVMLVSHAHRDHFQVEAARELLLARPEVVIVVHREVAALLADSWPAWDQVASRVEAVAPPDGAPVQWRSDGVVVEFHRMPHGEARTLPENLAHVVELGGRRVLHLGDAESTASQVESSGITGIDVALLPYWYWLGDAWSTARQRLAGRLGTVALHLPPAEVDTALTGVADPPLRFRQPLESAHF